VLEKDGEDQLIDRVRNEEVLHGDKEERNILHEIKEGRVLGLARYC
jgi:streptomycin 6-kinase